MSTNIVDIQLRFINTSMDITDEQNNRVTSIVVKQLQAQKSYINLDTGHSFTAPWEMVPEVLAEDLDEDGNLPFVQLEEEELTEEETVSRIESGDTGPKTA